MFIWKQDLYEPWQKEFVRARSRDESGGCFRGFSPFSQSTNLVPMWCWASLYQENCWLRKTCCLDHKTLHHPVTARPITLPRERGKLKGERVCAPVVIWFRSASCSVRTKLELHINAMSSRAFIFLEGGSVSGQWPPTIVCFIANASFEWCVRCLWKARFHHHSFVRHMYHAQDWPSWGWAKSRHKHMYRSEPCRSNESKNFVGESQLVLICFVTVCFLFNRHDCREGSRVPLGPCKCCVLPCAENLGG